ncbi:predicted protein [Enterococcus faecalis HIP11704]|nr:predicted protein [Enterococcus faecalis HIP11704]
MSVIYVQIAVKLSDNRHNSLIMLIRRLQNEKRGSPRQKNRKSVSRSIIKIISR